VTSDGALVSAIIIFRDEERFLAEAIESVLAQTYPHWELLLVDDGSTDRSTAIAHAYATRQPECIRYLEHDSHANHGMSATRNLGLRNARGKYVGFLDADDVWEPHKLQEQVAVMETHEGIDMVYGRTLLWHSWRSGTDTALTDAYCPLGLSPETVVEPPHLLLSLIENRVQTPTTCNALLRAEAITRVGGFEATFRGMFEDQVFFMKIALASRVFVSSRSWARYRQREDSHSARAEATGEVAESRARLLAWLDAYLRAQRVRHRSVWRALRRQRMAMRWPALHGLCVRFDRLMNRLRADGFGS
jgi:glycosyltransferase involved in cell wall biosynthesis